MGPKHAAVAAFTGPARRHWTTAACAQEKNIIGVIIIITNDTYQRNSATY